MIVLTVAIVVLVLFAGLFALGRFPGFSGPSAPAGSPTHTVQVDLCNASLGIDCRGNQIVLPVSVDGSLQNHSTCDAIPAAGSSESLQLGFSTSAPAEGTVIPQTSFSGPGGFASDPLGFLSNGTDRALSPWTSGNLTGVDTATVRLPAGGSTWCVVWFAPAAGSTITWTNDVVYSYLAPT